MATPSAPSCEIRRVIVHFYPDGIKGGAHPCEQRFFGKRGKPVKKIRFVPAEKAFAIARKLQGTRGGKGRFSVRQPSKYLREALVLQHSCAVRTSLVQRPPTSPMNGQRSLPFVHFPYIALFGRKKRAPGTSENPCSNWIGATGFEPAT